MTTTGTTEARKAALFANTSTPVLVQSLLMLDAVPGRDRTDEQKRVHAWTCGELENRHPEITDVLEAWATDYECELSYAEALIAALPVSAVTK